MTSALLRLSGITKSYPGVRANDDVSFEIAPGEIHALLGENGAGKSTLVKAIYGLVKPDAGQMTLNGERYMPAEPRAARAAGVAMVFQHFSLFEALPVAENVALPEFLSCLSDREAWLPSLERAEAVVGAYVLHFSDGSGAGACARACEGGCHRKWE